MSNMLKILVVGDFLALIHEPALSDAFEKLGHRVDTFKFREYLPKKGKGFLSRIFQLYYNCQIKFRTGPAITKINQKLSEEIAQKTYDLIFFYRPEYLHPSVLKGLHPGTVTFIYNNDDPFSTKYHQRFWFNYFSLAKICSHIFYYRPSNKFDYEKIGFDNTSLLRSYYIEDLNCPIELPTATEYSCDVIFIGHYEDDGREESIKLLIERDDIRFKLFGPEWRKSKYYSLFTDKLGKITPLQKDYNLAINSSKIALVFLSKLNNDSYTRRCFEIPATGTFMLAEYSEDLESLFVEGQEAEYFRSPEEMIQKIEYYLDNPAERGRIARAGYQRLISSQHEVKDRARMILDEYSRIIAK